MTHHDDPFVGGIQTAEDRKKKIAELNIAQIIRVLERPDLQPSIRRYAEERLQRLSIDWQPGNTLGWGKRHLNQNACKNCQFVDPETARYCQKFRIKTQQKALCSAHVWREGV